MKECNKCNSCNPCDCNCKQEECGCKFEVEAQCVRYTKKDLECLDLPRGATLEKIVDSIEDKMCTALQLTDGLTSYEIALQEGFEGTQTEWLASLKGQDGVDGEDGAGDVLTRGYFKILNPTEPSSGVIVAINEFQTPDGPFLLTPTTISNTSTGEYTIDFSGVQDKWGIPLNPSDLIIQVQPIGIVIDPGDNSLVPLIPMVHEVSTNIYITIFDITGGKTNTGMNINIWLK